MKKKANSAEGAAKEKELQGETAEKKYESEKPEIEGVVITAETTVGTAKTEVTANG